MQVSQPDNFSRPTLRSARCKLPGERAHRQAAILQRGECGRVRAFALVRGELVYAAGCGFSAATMKPSQSTCGPNRIEMTQAFPPRQFDGAR